MGLDNLHIMTEESFQLCLCLLGKTGDFRKLTHRIYRMLVAQKDVEDPYSLLVACFIEPKHRLN